MSPKSTMPTTTLSARPQIVAVAHEHVVVVQIAVDDRARAADASSGTVCSIDLADDASIAAPSAASVDQRSLGVDDGAPVREVPVEVAMERGMIEVDELALERANLPAEVLEQRAAIVRDASTAASRAAS